MGSIASAGSIGSIGSIGSVASIGSIGSIASIGSIGSIASIGARGAVGSGGDPRACARDRARVGFPGRPRARRGGLFATFLTLALQLFVALLAAQALRP